ncbi:MAG: 3'-5' exonuclease, partial [Lachnospiraceae bacterium]|nr:3'-5' exonuclease [Lachnospiraceae bacterium]
METYVAIDLETTGLSPKTDKIIEIGAVRVVNGKITDRLQLFADPGRLIPQRITDLTGITQDMLTDAVSQEEAIRHTVD